MDHPGTIRRSVAHALLAIVACAAVGAAPARAVAANCGVIISPALVQGVSTGASHVFHRWRYPGSGATGCSVTDTNAYGCTAAMANLRAVFSIASHTAGMSCMFDCGPRGSCTIRGGDGLPVELLSFGVD